MVSFNTLFSRKGLAHIFLVLSMAANASAQNALPEPKPVPPMQVIPLPHNQASFQRNGVEIARYHFGPALHRPFLFPIIGLSGRSLTRMGHPHDPESHSHHNSVWISHHDVNGTNFWSDGGKGKIRHKRIVKFEDSAEDSSMVTENQWATNKDKVLLFETRRLTTLPLDDSEWLLIIDLRLEKRLLE